MRRACGTITGGWRRVAILDVQNCLLELKQKIFHNSTRSCVVRENNGGCTSIFYSSLGIPYSIICGRIRAYKVGTPDEFSRINEINNNYLDGISITINTSTNKAHVWSFAAGEDVCVNSQPDFVDNDFACDMSRYCPFETLCGLLLWNMEEICLLSSKSFHFLTSVTLNSVSVGIK